jgi:hypothetical protein
MRLPIGVFFQFFRLNYLVSGLTCQEQEAPGQGQLYGRNSQISSCSAFSFSPNDILQPVDLCLHGNIRLFATFSIAKFRMLPRVPRQVGQQDNFGRQLAQTRCPTWHCIIGGRTISKQTGHSNSAASSSVRVPGVVPPGRVGNWHVELEEAEVSPLLIPRRLWPITWAIILYGVWLIAYKNDRNFFVISPSVKIFLLFI